MKEGEFMPLPLIPLVVAGVTAASATLAGKKGYDSYKNMKETKDLAEWLESKYKRAFKHFESSRDKTNKTFEEYGLLKLQILDDTMKDFVSSFKQIKNVNFKGEVVTDTFVSNKNLELFVLDIEKQVVKAGQVMTAGVASIAGGGLAAMGALGATTTFAAASTGTAIASLSGIAAQNATLAFLGGGALSAGGLGIAGGTMVLGGIALAPALAIGSLIFASSTEKKLEEMYNKKTEVELEVQKLESTTAVMMKIRGTTNEMYKLTSSTKSLLEVKIKQMNNIIQEKGLNFECYNEDEQNIIYQNYKLAVVMKEILNTTILNDEGSLAPNILSFIKAEKLKLDEIRGN